MMNLAIGVQRLRDGVVYLVCIYGGSGVERGVYNPWYNHVAEPCVCGMSMSKRAMLLS